MQRKIFLLISFLPLLSIELFAIHTPDNTDKAEPKGRVNLVKDRLHIHKDSGFTCNPCGHTFCSKSSFTAHIRYKHLKQKKARCSECNLPFAQPSHLQRHILAVHKKIKYPCTQCNIQCSNKANLEAHVRSKHIGEQHPCPMCPAILSRPSNLKRHIRTIHPEKKNSAKEPETGFEMTSQQLPLLTIDHLPIHLDTIPEEEIQKLIDDNRDLDISLDTVPEEEILKLIDDSLDLDTVPEEEILKLIDDSLDLDIGMPESAS